MGGVGAVGAVDRAGSGWRAAVRRRARRPADLVEGTRWLFAGCALVALALTLPASLPGITPVPAILLLAGSATLVASWLYGYFSRSAPLALDLVDAAAYTAFALAGPSPATVFGVLFNALWFRSLYGSTGRAVLRCGLYALGVAAALPLWGLIPGHAATTAPGLVLGPIPVMFLTVVAGRQLAIVLTAREQSRQRDRAVAAVGTRLLGVTDAARIAEQAWVAAADICAATPGLRMLAALREGGSLRVAGTAGAFAAVPATLPPDTVPADPDPVVDVGPLNAAAGCDCEWVCLPLPARPEGEGWMLVGASGKLPPDALLAVRAMINQVALALRNSEVHGQLTTQARTDALTGLANRAAFTAALGAAVADEAVGSVAVLFVDLDDFKNVNDVLGHAAGDELLRQVATRLRQVVRAQDLCARLGGDEFAVLLVDGSGTAAETVARRLVETLAAPIRLGVQVAQVGASVGLAHGAAGIDAEQLVQRADVAMYAAKANGKNRVQVFEPGLLGGDGRASFERQLATAAAAGELVVHYQPILSLPDARCTAVEALVRWQHPDRGLLPPGEFIDAAERTGAIVDIGAFVLRRACADSATWRAAHPDAPLAVHVNVSARQLDDEDFQATVTGCLSEFAVPAKCLVLEVTESMVIDSPATIDRLNALAGLGVAIALDDFGTGYAALTTLRALPVDIVKIDRSFVTGGPSNPADQAVIEAIVQMATRLGLRTVAEGVERLDEEQFLRAAGADSVQGYLHLRPTPAAEFGAWLADHLAGIAGRRDSGPGAVVRSLTPRRIG